MNSVMAVARRELKTFFSSPIGYVVLGFFLLIAGWFYFTPLFLAGQASMRGFFGTAPLIFVFLVPAITMRSIAEERKAGTLELLLTMPIENWQVVTGKFIAALGMVCAGLVFTIPYALTVSSLTGPGAAFDWGPVAAGYLGLVLLASAFIALGLWASALSKNQIVGFLVALVVCFTFYILDKFAPFLPEWLGGVVEYLSVDTHFENIARGVIDTRDVLFYVSLTVAGLMLTTQLLANLRQELSTKSVASPTAFTLAVIGSLVLLNILSLRAFARIDVTQDKMYTLSAATKETLAGLDDQVTITAYFTADLPAQYAPISSYTRDMLEEFRSASKGKVSFEFIDPAKQETDKDKETKREVKRDIFGRNFRSQTSVEKELATQGIKSIPLPVVQEDARGTRDAWLGLVIRHHEKKEVIPVVQNLPQLEYDLTTLVRKLVRPKTPVIGLLQGHGEPNPQEKLRNLATLISQQYELRPVELQGKERFEPELDGLLVLGPETPLAPNELKAIDQLLMEGKPVAMFLDTVHIDLRAGLQPKPAEHGLQPLLTAYGITVQSDAMVVDAQSETISISEQRGGWMIPMQVQYPFIAKLKRLEGDSPVTRGIGDIAFPFASKVTAAPGDGKTVTVLARSSAKSWTEAKPQNLDPRRNWQEETITFNGPHDLMVAVTGKWKSAFAAEGAMSAPGVAPLLTESKGESRLIVAGTAALFQDDFFGRPNQVLVQNVADWMLLDPALLAMRTRGLQLASFKTELSEGTRSAAKFGNTFGLPLALAVLGIIRWRMREARRTRIAL